MPNEVHAVMDLRRLFAKDNDLGKTKKENKSDTDDTKQAEPDAEVTKENPEQSDKGPKLELKDWEEELENRKKENDQKDSSHKKTDGELLEKFWTDYFTSNWKPNVAAKLKEIELLQKDILDLGFDPLINPLLAFFLRNYVQQLVLEDLVNAETFKALHNAVANRYIADSEFVKENAYNILYCRDLYEQPARDILEYLRIQKSILSPSAPAYNKETRNTNIKIFLENGVVSVMDKDATLNSLEEAKALAGRLGSGKVNQSDDTTDNEETDNSADQTTDDDQEENKSSNKQTNMDRVDLEQLVRELDGDGEVLAALQYVCMRKGSNAAFETLKKVKKPGTAADVISATPTVVKRFKNVKLDKNSINILLDLLTKELS